MHRMTEPARRVPLTLMGLCFGLAYITLFFVIWLPLRGVLEIQTGTNQGAATSHAALAIAAVALIGVAAHALRARGLRLAPAIAFLAVASAYALIVVLALGDPGEDAVAVMIPAAAFLCPATFPASAWLVRRAAPGRP